MRFELTDGISVEVSEDSLLVKILGIVEYAKAHIEHLNTHDYEDGDGYDWRILDNLVDETWDSEYHDFVYSVYCEVDIAERESYRIYAEPKFLEYASHMGEDGFDWSFYSDLHKDIYGFRPRR